MEAADDVVGSGRVMVAAPNPDSGYYARLPYGIVGLLSHLEEVLRHLRRKKNFEPTVIVVDTGLSFANLGPAPVPNIEDNAKTYWQKMLKESLNCTAYIWYVWTPAALMREDDITASRTAISQYNYTALRKLVRKVHVWPLTRSALERSAAEVFYGMLDQINAERFAP